MGLLTEMIHRAYAPLAAQGLHYWATHQSVEDTIERCGQGETWVAEIDRRLVGTITLSPPERPGGAPWYDRPDVAKFNQFCVDPSAQGAGVGRGLMDRVESRAAELGARHLGCDTSEQALGLIALYERRGYVFVENVDWRPDVNYLSVILSLELG